MASSQNFKMCDCSGSVPTSSLGRFGAWAGDKAWEAGAKRIKSWTGYGDYNIVSNSLVNNGSDISSGGTPSIESRGRSVVIRYREYLGEVTTGATIGAFNAVTYQINPANVLTFPWLAPIAQQFDQYKPHGVIFEFRSTATDTTTNASLGSVMIATDYDVVDAPYTSKQEMMNSAYASESKSSDSMLHGIECDPKELQRRMFYTRRVGSSTGSSDARDYDLCNTTIATSGGGLAANQSVGSLYIHYEFEFFKEHVWGGIASRNQLWSVFSGSSITSIAGGGDWAVPIGGSATRGVVPIVGGINMGIEMDSTTIWIPRKWAGASFEVTYALRNTTQAAPSAVSGGVYVDCSVLFGDYDNSSALWQWSTMNTGVNAFNQIAIMRFTMNDIITAPFATITHAGAGLYPATAQVILKATMTIRIIDKALYTLV